MKSIFIFVLSQLCSPNDLLISAQQSGLKGLDFILPEQAPILDIRIETGLADMNCQGPGLCNLALDMNWKITDKLVTHQGHGTATLVNDQLEISILKRSVDARTTNSFFAGTTFQMGADLEVPAVLVKELGLESYTIKAGYYLIYRTKEVFKIYF